MKNSPYDSSEFGVGIRWILCRIIEEAVSAMITKEAMILKIILNTR